MYRHLTTMSRRRLTAIFGVIVVSVALASCAAQPKSTDLAGAGAPVTPGSKRDFSVNVGDKVFFQTDSAALTTQSQSTLQGQARWLNQYPNYTITLEGHADERGTREYNLSLGAQRALAVKNYLAGLGVSPARMRTISYGKERPVALCNDISCWSQNRRTVTVLNKRS